MPGVPGVGGARSTDDSLETQGAVQTSPQKHPVHPPAQLCVGPRRVCLSCPPPSSPLPSCSFGTKRKLPRAGARSPRGPPAANTEGRGWSPAGSGLEDPQGLGPSTHPSLSTRSSVCRLSSREKISLQDLSKERRPGGAGGAPIRDEDEGEEAPSGEGLGAWIPGSEEEEGLVAF